MQVRGRVTQHLTVAIAAALVLASCTQAATPAPGAAPGSPQKQFTIVMVGATATQAFWQTVQKGAEQAGKDLGVTVKYSAPKEQSDGAMIELLEPAIATKPDGVAIVYTGKTMEAITKKALASGAKVVIYNNNRFEKTDSGDATTDPAIIGAGFVGQDETRSGAVLATAMLKYLPPGGGRVLLVNVNPKSLLVGLRLAAATSVLTARGYAPDVLIATQDMTQNLALTGAYLQGHPDTKGILSVGVNGIAPAAQYVDQNKLNIPVCGFDLNDVVFGLLKTGTSLKCLLNQQPYLQGYLTIQNLYLALKFGFAPVQINTGSLIIDKTNMDKFEQLVKDGLG